MAQIRPDHKPRSPADKPERFDGEPRGRRLQRQDALVEFARASVAGLTRREVFRASAALLRDGLPIDFCIAFEIRDDKSDLAGCASVGWDGDPSRIHVDPKADDFAARATRAQRPLILSLAPGSSNAKDPSLHFAGVVSAVGLPLRVGQHAFGSLVGYSRSPRSFEGDMRFLDAIAGVAAVALERERAQRRADDASARVAGLLNAVAEHFVHVDRSWNISFINSSAAGLFGAKPIAMIGKPVAHWFPSFTEESRRCHYESAMFRGETSLFDFRSSLNKRWYEARVFPTSDGIGVFYLDITARREAEEARLQGERRMRALIDNVPAITWLTDPELTIVTSVGGGLKKLGLDDDALAGSHLPQLFEDGPTLRAHERALRGEASDYEDSFNGRTYVSHVEPLREDGTIVGTAGLAVDITEQLRAEHRLADAQALAQFGAWSFDLVTGDKAFSDELLRIFGRSLDTMPSTPHDFEQLVHVDDAQRVRTTIRAAARSGKPWKVDHRIVASDGTVRFVENAGRCVLDYGRLIRSYGSVLDITERKLAENELVRLANFDVLTGLPNRSHLTARIAQAIGDADERNDVVAVCCVDIDRFKVINHTLGHEAGDELLRAVAERLSSICRTGDVIGRIGSAEYVIAFAGITSDAESGVLSEALRSEFARPFEIAGRDMFVTFSAGMSFYPRDGGDPETLIRRADTALERAKSLGGDQLAVFEPAMSARDGDALDLRNSMYRALDRNEFYLNYQPIVESANRRVHTVEALIRWKHPARGVIAPNDFIPLAEQSGLIVPIGAWVLREACRNAFAWRRETKAGVAVSVNLSARQFTDAKLTEIVSEALSASGLEPGDLCLEVTETAVIGDLQNGAAILRSLNDLGVSIAIDDFGTGYSSLNYLRSFGFDTLKMDRSFVQGLPNRTADATVARAIIALGHALGMKVTAEGVETEEQASFLGREGCDLLQGYMVSKPVPERQVPSFIAQYRS